MGEKKIAASLSPSSKRDAYDRVYFARVLVQQALGWRRCATGLDLSVLYRLPAQSLPANELATLLYVTSAQEPKYAIAQTQCYWFATTVFDALKMLYKGSEQDPMPHLGGTICGVPVDFKASREEKKEQRQREREQRQAVEEAMKRAEEERRAAEEGAQAAEEER
ncbi:hypothetical protein F5J12DRAFT_930230 [Pisolithus orientalis]|uniref:uncharacterized protein n=1 Tax=Pisolithus orientalis TaxID=936130 RepID=UPI002225690D|nr:uncharacterized protein F5J12DRAFT_930230 [Pisolithus orientalis]KAI5987277.1 hypothetical protein F5J12DRAFT_930230 [Pisolithus orientalis]